MINQEFFVGWLKFRKLFYRYNVESRNNKVVLIDRMNDVVVLDLGVEWEWLRPFGIDRLTEYFECSVAAFNEFARDKDRYIPQLTNGVIYGKTIDTDNLANELKVGDYLQATGSRHYGSVSMLVQELTYFKGGKRKGQVKHVIDAPREIWGKTYPSTKMTAHKLNTSPHYIGNGLFLKRGNVVYMVE